MDYFFNFDPLCICLTKIDTKTHADASETNSKRKHYYDDDIEKVTSSSSSSSSSDEENEKKKIKIPIKLALGGSGNTAASVGSVRLFVVVSFSFLRQLRQSWPIKQKKNESNKK